MISLVFLGYDHLKPTCGNRFFNLFARLISPRWATVAVNIDGEVHLWTPEGTHFTTVDALHEICNKVEEIVIHTSWIISRNDDPDGPAKYVSALMGAKKQTGRLRVALALISKRFQNCATIASTLIGERIVTPDALYERVKR